MQTWGSVAGKRVLITGATSGIGLAAAVELVGLVDEQHGFRSCGGRLISLERAFLRATARRLPRKTTWPSGPLLRRRFCYLTWHSANVVE